MFEQFTDRARKVVVLAQEEARMLDHHYIGTEHLLLGLFREGDGVAAKALVSSGISLEAVRQQVEEIIGRGQLAPPGNPFTSRAKEVLELSVRESRLLDHRYVGTEHILLGLLHEGKGVAAQALGRLGVGLSSVRMQVIQLLYGIPLRNLTAAARQGSLALVLGRESEIERVIQALARGTPGPVFLVGERGTGVSAVAHGLAEAVLRPGTPSSLVGVEVVEVDLKPLGGHAQNADHALAILADRIRELSHTILFIERSCVRVGTVTRHPAIAYLESALAEAEVRAVAAATPGEVRDYLGADARLGDSFKMVEVGELSAELSVRVLDVGRDRYEAEHRVEITDAAIAAAVALSGEYAPRAALPGRAITLLNDAAAQAARRTVSSSEAERAVAEVRAQKEAAIESQDFELAADFRAREEELLKVREQEQAAAERDRRNVPTYRIVAVTEQDVAAVAAGRFIGRRR
jgi:ATP-dependent Clp protease ATP-binding subunit ClpC